MMDLIFSVVFPKADLYMDRFSVTEEMIFSSRMLDHNPLSSLSHETFLGLHSLVFL